MPANLLGELIAVTASISEAPLAPETFGRVAIMGQHTRFGDRWRRYTSLAAMVADGFLTTDAEYLEAQALLAQSGASGRRVVDFLIGRRSTPVAQVMTGTAVFGGGTTYTITITVPGLAPVTVNVPANTDSATTASDIASAINGSAAGAEVTAAATSGGAFTITSDNPGISFVVTSSVAGGAGTLSFVSTTANVGIAEDLTAMGVANADFYAIVMTSRDTQEIVLAAEWVESAATAHMLLAQSSQAAILAAVYSPSTPYADVASELRANGYTRTALFYHSVDAEPMAAAVAGRVLPFRPGRVNWAHKNLIGITADSLTDTQRGYLIGSPTDPSSGKYVNVYLPITSSTSRTLRGTVASGRDIEVQRTVDYLRSQVTITGANLLLSQPKISFDDPGITLYANAVRGTLNAEVPEVITTPPDVVAPRASQISSTDRQNGVLNPPLTVSVQLSGALKFAQVEMTVSP